MKGTASVIKQDIIKQYFSILFLDENRLTPILHNGSLRFMTA